MSAAPAPRHYAAIFVLAFAILALEITVARILSVALLSHFAFVAISLAMFGLGLSGLAVYLFPRWFTAARVDAQVIASLSGFGVSAGLSVLAFLHLHVVQQLSLEGFATLALAYTLLALPFVCGGLGVALLMTHFSAAIGPLYAADLLGASAGCIAVVAGLSLLPAPLVAVAIAAFACAAALALGLGRGPRRALLPLAACAVAAWLVGMAAAGDGFTMQRVKFWEAQYSDYEAWNAFSRVSAFDYGPDAAQGLGLTPTQRQGRTFPRVMMIDIDGTAWTPMLAFDGDPASIQFLRESVLYIAHRVRPQADVLVVGTGGGRDLLAARAFDQRSIAGIELNPLMRHLVEERYGDFSGHPYTATGAEVTIDEARSRLASVDRRFGVIQLSLIDTFSLNAAGGVVFSENYLYTVEAFREYYRHLTDDGVLSVSRYMAPAYPLEVLKVLAMARQAWTAEAGPVDFSRYVAVLSQGLNATMLIKRTPFTDAEIQTLAAAAAANAMVVRYLPGVPGGHPELAALVGAPDLGAHLAAHPFHIAPSTDDRPFFFHFLRGRLADLPTDKEDPFQMLRQWNDAQWLMYLLIAVVVSLAGVFFVGPLLVFSRRAVARQPLRVTAPLLLYFACLGYGFMMIEIPLMQRFILLLGYPVYALAVILFALLLFSGLGSLLSSRWADRPAGALGVVLAAIVGLGALYVWALPHAIAALMGVPLALKIGFTVACLAPIGLVLGMAYPLGIAVLRGVGEELVPWAWGLNGALSVVASVAAVFLGSRLGFGAVMLSGLAAYAVAWGCIRAATPSVTR